MAFLLKIKTKGKRKKFLESFLYEKEKNNLFTKTEVSLTGSSSFSFSYLSIFMSLKNIHIQISNRILIEYNS